MICPSWKMRNKKCRRIWNSRMRPNKIFGSSSRRKKSRSKVCARNTKENDRLSNSRDLKMKNMPDKKTRRRNRWGGPSSIDICRIWGSRCKRTKFEDRNSSKKSATNPPALSSHSKITTQVLVRHVGVVRKSSPKTSSPRTSSQTK